MKPISLSEYTMQTLHALWDGIWLKLGVTSVIALPVTLFGVDSKIILALAALFILDLFTGIIRSLALGHKIQSKRLMDSVLKGILYMAFIFGSWLMTQIFQEYVPVHTWAVTLACLVEFASVLENIREAGVKLPGAVDEWVKTALEKFRNKQ